MRRVIGLLLVVLVSGCGGQEQSAQVAESTKPLEATWDERVEWPNGDALVVAAPRHLDKGGVADRAWVELRVTLTNAGAESRRVSDHSFDAYTDGRKIKPVIPDVDGQAAIFQPLGAGQSVTYSVVFATATLGKRLTLEWKSSNAQRWPNTTISGDAVVQ